MAGPNQRLDGQLSRFRLEAGNLFTAADVVRLGEAMVTMWLRLAMMGFYDNFDAVPATGVLGEQDGTFNHLTVTKGTGDLEYDVSTGVGFAYDGTASDADPLQELDYRMFVLDTAVNDDAVTAHDPTNPRIDVISLGSAADVTDTGESRVTRDVVTGDPVDPDPTVNVRTRISGAITVTAGTPAATPSAPATPAGHIKLAEILVPATSGAITVTDFREYISLTEAFRGMTTNWMHENHLVGAGYVITDNGTTFDMGAGVYTYEGRARRYAGEDAVTYGTLPTGDNERVNLISFDPSGGNVEVTAGTDVDVVVVDGGEPLPPALPAGNIRLYEVRLDSVGEVSTKDVREYGHIDNQQLRQDAIEPKHVKRDTRTILIPPGEFSVYADDLSVSTYSVTGDGSAVTMSTGADAIDFFCIGGVRLPPGSEITAVGWMGYEVSGTATMEGGMTRNLALSSGGTPDSENIAADAAPAALGATITVNSPALFSSEDPQVIKSLWTYGFAITFALSASSSARFLGAYVVVETPELVPQGEDGDVS